MKLLAYVDYGMQYILHILIINDLSPVYFQWCVGWSSHGQLPDLAQVTTALAVRPERTSSP